MFSPSSSLLQMKRLLRLVSVKVEDLGLKIREALETNRVAREAARVRRKGPSRAPAAAQSRTVTSYKSQVVAGMFSCIFVYMICIIPC